MFRGTMVSSIFYTLGDAASSPVSNYVKVLSVTAPPISLYPSGGHGKYTGVLSLSDFGSLVLQKGSLAFQTWLASGTRR